MKKQILTVVSLLLLGFNAIAQAPGNFNYQVVIRDASSTILNNQAVGIQIAILQGSPSGTSVYLETHALSTNTYGLVNLAIGSGTTTDDFSVIDWGNGPYFIQTAVDITGGTTYSVIGVSQLISVPYALYAETSGSSAGVTDDITLEGDGSVGNEYQIKNAGVTTTQIAPSTTDGQVLTTTGGAVSWETPSGGGIQQVTEAGKNAMTGAAVGTMVYQTDEFKGIYVKETDGWRSQSPDAPITYIDVDNPPAGGFPITLDATHNTIYIYGSWDQGADIPRPITLPDPSIMKGRIYRIVVNNGASYTPPNTAIEENGWLATLDLSSIRYIRLDEAYSNSGSSLSINLPANRAIVLQSDGVNWVEIQNDKTDVTHINN